MTTRLPDHLLERLFELGQAIDVGESINVFAGGEVGLGNHCGAKEHQHERQGSRRPAAGSRKGPAGSRGSSGEAGNSIGRVWPEWLIGEGLTLLLGSYPGSQVSLDKHGAWLKIPVAPLGAEGPLAILVVALAKSRHIHPRCWAFWVEPVGIRGVGPRHTNYPHADACAFPQFQGYWERRDGIRPYIDIHAEWLIRQLYYQAFTRWVGRQMAPFALYALNQFCSIERCHCQSSRTYGECCQAADFAEYQADRVRQVKLALEFTCYRWFNSQMPPIEIVQFVFGGRGPDLVQTYRSFRELARFVDRRKAFKKHLLGSTAGARAMAQTVSWRAAA